MQNHGLHIESLISQNGYTGTSYLCWRRLPFLTESFPWFCGNVVLTRHYSSTTANNSFKVESAVCFIITKFQNCLAEIGYEISALAVVSEPRIWWVRPHLDHQEMISHTGPLLHQDPWSFCQVDDTSSLFFPWRSKFSRFIQGPLGFP